MLGESCCKSLNFHNITDWLYSMVFKLKMITWQFNCEKPFINWRKCENPVIYSKKQTLPTLTKVLVQTYYCKRRTTKISARHGMPLHRVITLLPLVLPNRILEFFISFMTYKANAICHFAQQCHKNSSSIIFTQLPDAVCICGSVYKSPTPWMSTTITWCPERSNVKWLKACKEDTHMSNWATWSTLFMSRGQGSGLLTNDNILYVSKLNMKTVTKHYTVKVPHNVSMMQRCVDEKQQV